jgi:surfactin synthase thioesterase subunit
MIQPMTISSDKPLTLLCLPPSGGSAREYQRWQGALGEGYRVVPVDLPGRGRRAQQRDATTFDEVTRMLLSEIPAHGSYALVGHSLGGLIAYELARRALAESLPLPEFVTIAACRPPHLTLNKAGLLSCAMRDSPFARMFLPALRADLGLLATYRHPIADLVLPVELKIWFGSEDRAVPRLIAEDWGLYTSVGCRTTVFPGGHFFVRDEWEACAGQLRGRSGTGISANPR